MYNIILYILLNLYLHPNSVRNYSEPYFPNLVLLIDSLRLLNKITRPRHR